MVGSRKLIQLWSSFPNLIYWLKCGKLTLFRLGIFDLKELVGGDPKGLSLHNFLIIERIAMQLGTSSNLMVIHKLGINRLC